MAAAGIAGRGLTSARIRRYHHRIVLQRLRSLGEASKADLARAADLTNTAIGQIVTELQELGLVSVVGKRHGGQRGQPATMLRLEPNGAYGIGVRLDRTRIETALVDLGGTMVAQRTHNIPLPSPEAALDLVTRDIDELLAAAERLAPGRVLGIGLARPDSLGAWLDRLDIDNPALALWDKADFAGALAMATGFDVHEENDGTAAAIAELFHGFGREKEDFVYFFVGPAIGGGVILDGDYRRGIGGAAGDVAVLPVGPCRLPSAPPARPVEILLTRASISALVRHLGYRGHQVRTLDELPAAILACPDGFEEWLVDCVDALVAPILSAQALLDVPDIVIDGDLGRVIMEDLAARLREALPGVMPEARTAPRLRVGSFGSNAHSMGAASLPLFIDFAPRAAISANARPVGRKGGTDARVA
jgi:predicted NBD/HSP70 family sugar kinase